MLTFRQQEWKYRIFSKKVRLFFIVQNDCIVALYLCSVIHLIFTFKTTNYVLCTLWT